MTAERMIRAYAAAHEHACALGWRAEAQGQVGAAAALLAEARRIERMARVLVRLPDERRRIT